MTKSEIQKSDLELELNRGKTEEAGLRDALHKMQQLNEGLGQDKIELNKIIIMVSKTIRNTKNISSIMVGHRGRDRMVVEFTTTCGMSTYHHLCCEFKSRSGKVYSIQHYVIKFVSDLQQVSGFHLSILNGGCSIFRSYNINSVFSQHAHVQHQK